MTQTDEYPPGIFHSPTPKDRQHITQKPEAVMQWAMRIVKPGGMVLDPFMGSGTTVKMAKETGRRAIGIELDERFAEIAANRCAETFYIPPSETPEVEDQPSLFGLG
jgi:site-specific DNA-methyltransferase (adenine-specific)